MLAPVKGLSAVSSAGCVVVPCTTCAPPVVSKRGLLALCAVTFMLEIQVNRPLWSGALSATLRAFTRRPPASTDQAIGGTRNGRRCGAFGNVAATSFYPAKPLGCYGDGGAMFTNDDGLAAALRSFAFHGKGETQYDNVRVGVNSRLDTLQAAILIEKLAILEDEMIARQAVAKRACSSRPRPGFVPTLCGRQMAERSRTSMQPQPARLIFMSSMSHPVRSPG